jgi:hypothetical protein
MKTTFIEDPKPEVKPFPGLYRHNKDQVLVLATDNATGTVLNSGNTKYEVGWVSDAWINISNINYWTKVTGSVKFE